jgi:hypothetical protein
VSFLLLPSRLCPVRQIICCLKVFLPKSSPSYFLCHACQMSCLSLSPYLSFHKPQRAQSVNRFSLYPSRNIVQGCTNSSNIRSHLKILGFRRTKWSKFLTVAPKTLGPTVQNLLVWAIWRSAFLHPYYNVCIWTKFWTRTCRIGHDIKPVLLESRGMETLALVSACDMEQRWLVPALRVKFLFPSSWCNGHILRRIWR